MNMNMKMIEVTVSESKVELMVYNKKTIPLNYKSKLKHCKGRRKKEHGARICICIVVCV
jgi:hypothetical protein